MICPNCGNVIPDGSVFCPVCGSEINAQNMGGQQGYMQQNGYGYDPNYQHQNGYGYDPNYQQQNIQSAQPAPQQVKKASKGKYIAATVISAVCCTCMAVMAGALILRSRTADIDESSSEAAQAVQTTAAETAQTTETEQTTAATTTTATMAEENITAKDPERFHQKVEPDDINIRSDSYNRRFVSDNGNEVPLRIGPGEDYDIEQTLNNAGEYVDAYMPDNMAVNVFSVSNDEDGNSWSYLYFDSCYGWCPTDCLSMHPIAVSTGAITPPANESTFYYSVVTQVDRLIIKKAPNSKTSSYMFEMPIGQKLDVYGFKEGDTEDMWLYVKYDDEINTTFGWIRTRNPDTGKAYVDKYEE